MEGKKVSESCVEMRQLVMPHQSNPQNTIFGGVVMSWIDMAGSMVASRHSGKHVVTAHIDGITFKAPMFVGNHAHIKSSIHYVGRTSMEIGVEVKSEDPLTGIKRITTLAQLTFVALDEFKKPCAIPPLILETEQQKKLYEEAKARHFLRKKKI